VVNVDVLNLEWSSFPSRDRIASTLVANYLRYQGVSVYEGDIFKGYQLIRKLKPKLLFINGSVGAKINHHIVKYAHSLGIKVVSFSAEGNYTENHPLGIDPFFWGWNKEKILFEDYALVWSRRVKDLIINRHKNLDKKIMICGGIGFDQFKIQPLANKSEFLSQYSKSKYKKVIGVGCWNFGGFYKDSPQYENKRRKLSIEQIKRFRDDAHGFNKILKKAIEEYPDILYIIKEHPGRTEGARASAIEGLDKYPNVLCIHSEESIKTCIEISDFWLFYESTTSLEAWLLDKMTFKLNPTGEDFIRNDVHKGSPLIQTFKQLNNLIVSFYSNQQIEIFDTLLSERKELVKSIINSSDGLNHVRAGNVIIEFLHKKSKAEIKSMSYKFQKRDEFINRIAYFFRDIINSKNKLKPFDRKELEQYTGSQYRNQIAYYNHLEFDKIELLSIKSNL